MYPSACWEILPIRIKVVKSGIYWHPLETTTVLPQFQVKPDRRGQGPAGRLGTESPSAVICLIEQARYTAACQTPTQVPACLLTDRAQRGTDVSQRR